jgi:phage gp36-like protein
MSKYGNEKVVIDGITFDSKKEGQRYLELKLLARAGKISDLKLQVRYPLSVEATNGKLVKICTYVADFTYCENGHPVVEDVKGFRTDVYKIKKNLMAALHGVEVREIT